MSQLLIHPGVAFVAIRLFAMYGRNWFVGTSLFILGALSPSAVTQVPTTLSSWKAEAALTGSKLATFGLDSVAAPWPFAPCISYMSDSDPLALLLYVSEP